MRNDGTCGMTLINERMIVYDPGLNQKELDETIVHEILHACFPTDLKKRNKLAKHEQEEKIVTYIAPILARALRQLRWTSK